MTEITSVNENFSDTQTMDRSALDYFQPDGGFIRGGSIKKITTPSVVLGIRAVKGVPEDIIEQAVEFYYKTGVKEARKNRKTYIIFGCIYNAALSFNHPLVAKKLAKQCGMRHDEITTAMSTFNKCGNKDLVINIHVTPSMFIHHLCWEINMDHMVDDIKMVIAEVMDRAPQLQDYQPLLMAAAAIYYYVNMLLTGSVTLAQLSEASCITASSIEKLSKDIDYYHNDCE